MKSIHSIEFILETRKLTIGGNGKIVIYKGRNEIFFPRYLQYNDSELAECLYMIPGDCETLQQKLFFCRGVSQSPNIRFIGKELRWS